MNILEKQDFTVKVQTRSGTYIVSIQRNGEILELRIEEPNAKRIEYRYEAGRLNSRDQIGNRVYYIESLHWTMEHPVYDVVGPEINRIANKAIEVYLQYEQEGQVHLR